jgi:type VI secretion system secreted protein VgrG
MDASKTGPITISTPLADDVMFHSMGGIEGLSQTFAYEVDVVSMRSDITANKLLGEPVTVHLELNDEAAQVRHWNGRVTRFEYLETDDDGQSFYRLTLRPWLWQLGLTTNWRVWQHLTVPEIATRVFQERGFEDFENALTETYEQREYVVQYGETDLQFVSRLLEREGIYYFFRHDDGKHTLVLADSPQAHHDAPTCASLPYLEDKGTLDSQTQYVRAWRAAEQIASGAYAEADFDFTKPRMRLFARAAAAGDDVTSKLEIYEFPGDFQTSSQGDASARLRLSQARRDIKRRTGDTNAHALTVGSTFELTDHPREDQNGKYLVTSARYRLQGHGGRATGKSDEMVFSCAFGVIDAAQTFRPPLVEQRPIAYGPQTATVVGPGGQEIWTDQYGRIKVQFHWDREGQLDENSSCWVRVSQAWAGRQFGAQFIPRIGDEVIVEFLGADPDQPIVVGSVYNQANMPPFTLPQNQTQSGVWTNSTPNGTQVNGNAVRFEDSIGNEELYLQAEKDMNVLAKHDQNTTVKNRRTVSVGADDSLSITGNRTSAVGLTETASVTLLQTVLVGSQVVTVGTAQAIGVGTTQTVTVGTDRALTINGKDTVSVLGERDVTISKDLNQSVIGDVHAKTTGTTDQSFSDDYTERHLGHRTVIVGTGDARRTAVVHVEGKGRAYASKTMEVEVLETFTLLCGKSQIVVTPGGITLNSPNITLAGKEVDVTGDTVKVTLTDAFTTTAKTVTVQTSGAQLMLDSSSANIESSAIKLGSGSGSSAQDSSKPVKVTKVLMKDPSGKPRANARVLLKKGDEVKMTVLDKDGMLELIGDDSYEVTFPDDAKAK